MDIKKILKNYNLSNLTIGVLGSHSALDACRGAKDLGFKTLVIVEKGRDKTYAKYYASTGSANNVVGCVDEVFYVNKFSDLLKEDVQKKLIEKNVIFIPHRSFEVYLNSDFEAIENKFNVPMFGSRQLLKVEERAVKPNQYDLMEKAKIRYPKQFKNPKEIDRLCIIKVLEKERVYERAFFLVDSYQGFLQESNRLLTLGKITENGLEKAVIEEFIVGVQVNFNFFYSPINQGLELVGTDTRRQTNLDGLLRLPENYQKQILENHLVELKYEEAGHIAVTVLESLLEPAFEIGEKFIKAAEEMLGGVIGPFGIQTMIIPGPPKKEIIVFDISPRMPGSPGIFASPYSSYLYGENLSMGKRVAMEIKLAIEKNKLGEILT
ncbi:DUF1297 domain-containing protein [Candidatus Daviesbacteria bacterium]|nr:DUF1297 domain-containing protein [Candidatus Daviesbacteria bacterium]